MIDSIALYAGAGAAFAGAVALLRPRSRKAGAIAIASGVAVAAAALAWPVHETRAGHKETLLDAEVEKWQFDEVHTIEVDAPPQRVYDAIRAVTANEIHLFRTLTAIRRFGRPGPESIMNAPGSQPILDVALRGGFRLLADDPPREIVLGTIIIPPRQAVAAMNFLITPIDANRCRVTTETRVYADNPAAIRRFATYWRIIHPGSDIIRRMWLRAVKRRAEDVSSRG
jgi:hypothetical protein